jgi:plastocyanin
MRLLRILASLVVVLAGPACQTSAVRDVTLVTRGMTFALAERPDEPNPMLRFRSGERVRLMLKNEATGLSHDVAIPAWNVSVDPIPSGQVATTVFTVPDVAGPVEYLCRPHAAMMNGVVDVTR